MMQGSPVQFHFEEVSPVEQRVSIEVASEHVNAKLEEAYRRLAREVSLRGFRKGKAPRSLLEQMFGKKIEQDVCSELLQEGLTAALSGHAVRMACEPTVEEMSALKKNEPLRFRTRLEVLPRVDVKDYDGIEVKRRAPACSDEDVEKVLMQRREQHMEMVPIEGRESARETDTLTLLVTGTLGQTRFAEDEVVMDLSDPRRQPIPGLGKALVGLPLSAKDHEVRFTLPEAGVPKELRGKEAALRISVKAAYEKRLPALDDDFAKDTSQAETLADLREQIRKDLLKEDEKGARRELREQLVDELIRRNPVPLPPSLVKRVSEQYEEDLRRRALLRAITEGTDPGAIDAAAIKQESEAETRKQLLTEFLLMAVSDKERIEITQAEVEKRLAEIASQSDKSVARVRAELQREDPQLNGLRDNLKLQKALDLLESRAKIMDAT